MIKSVELPHQTRVLEMATDTTATTEVGSYFISNYPPFSLWKRENVAEILAALERDARRRVAAGAVHSHSLLPQALQVLLLPRLHQPEREGDRKLRAGAGARSSNCSAGSRASRAASCKFVYFGGGTPSYLSAKQLLSLRDRLSEHRLVGHARRSHVRMRAGHAQPRKSQDAQGDRRHARLAGRRKLQRPRSSKKTAGRISRPKSCGPTTGFSRSAFRRSTST